MSSYLQPIVDPKKFKTLVRESRLMLTKIKRRTPFDVMVCRGLSGSSVAFALSYLTGIPVIYVRKPGATTHGTPIEVDHKINFSANHPIRYLIVDDLISSGDTMQSIYNDMNNHIGENKILCVGIFLHSTDSYPGIAAYHWLIGGKEVPIYGLKSLF